MAMRINSGSVGTPSFALAVQVLANSLVAYMKMLGDDAVGPALGHQRQGLKLPHGHAAQGIGGAPRLHEANFEGQVVTEIRTVLARHEVSA